MLLHVTHFNNLFSKDILLELNYILHMLCKLWLTFGVHLTYISYIILSTNLSSNIFLTLSARINYIITCTIIML